MIVRKTSIKRPPDVLYYVLQSKSKYTYFAYNKTKGCEKVSNCYGQKLNLLAAAFANALSEGMDNAEIDLLSTFLQLVGEALAVIPAASDYCNNRNNELIEK